MFRARFVLSTVLLFSVAALVVGQDPKQPIKQEPGKEAKQEPPKQEPPKQDPKQEVKLDPSARKFDLKLEKDKKFYQQMKTDVKQVIKVMGQDLTQTQDSTFYFKWTPIKQEGDKWELTDEVEGVKMSIDISGNKISYDSTAADGGPTAGNPGLMEFFKKLVGAKFTVTMDKNAKIEKVDGVKEFLNSLGSGNTNMSNVLTSIMTEDAVKQMCDPTFALMPDSPKKPGEKWKKETTLNLGPIGSYTVTYNFTYVGPDKEMDKIEVETTLVYNAPKSDAPGSLFRIKEGKLTTDGPTKGVIMYNTKLQRIESADITIKMKGELTVVIGMADTKVELLQTQETHISTSDNTLVPKKP